MIDVLGALRVLRGFGYVTAVQRKAFEISC